MKTSIKAVVTFILFSVNNLSYKKRQHKRGGMGKYKKQRPESNLKPGMKNDAGTERVGHVMTSDVVNQLDRVLQERCSSSH